MFLLCHALFVARSHMNNLCIAFQYLNLSGSGSALLKCKSEKNFVAGTRSAVPYLRFVTTATIGVGVLISSRRPILPFFAQRTRNFGLFWCSTHFFGTMRCTFTRLDNVVVSQNWQISGMGGFNTSLTLFMLWLLCMTQALLFYEGTQSSLGLGQYLPSPSPPSARLSIQFLIFNQVDANFFLTWWWELSSWPIFVSLRLSTLSE